MLLWKETEKVSINLRKYISDIRTLEIQRETLSLSIQSTRQKINQLCCPRKITTKENPVNLNFTRMFSGRLILIVAALTFGFYFTSLGSKEAAKEYYILATGQKVHGDGSFYYTIAAVLGGIVGIAIISMIIQYIVQMRRYKDIEQKNANQYHQETKFEEERLAREKTLQNKYKDALHTLENCYKETRNTLEALYNKNIIYAKYHNNLVAICMFHEYFESGRCTTLTGHEGAYNIFETEIRLGIIITNQEIIMKMLDKIQRNQYSLYTAIQQINKQQNRIMSSLNNISLDQKALNQNLEYLLYSTTAIKHNSDIALLYSLS